MQDELSELYQGLFRLVYSIVNRRYTYSTPMIKCCFHSYDYVCWVTFADITYKIYRNDLSIVSRETIGCKFVYSPSRNIGIDLPTYNLILSIYKHIEALLISATLSNAE